MNIFVCIKQVPDTETKIQPNGDKSFIDLNTIKWVMGPYDEFAVEQALLFKTAHPEANVTVVRVGQTKDTEALRTAMAMGADDAILVEAPDLLDPFSTAKAIKGAIEKAGKKPDLIFCGKQSIDGDNLQVPQILAQMCQLPCVSVIIGFEEQAGTQEFRIKREIEGGAVEVYQLKGPAVFTCNKALNTPRYASLPGIMKAKKKPLTTYSLSDVLVTAEDQRIRYSNFRLPPEKPAGKKFDARDEKQQADIVKKVAELLRNEAKVL
jgi:electron transfer flavoprotein beta subunit